MAGVIGGRRGIEGQPLSVAVDLSIDAEYFNWMMRTRPHRSVYMSSSAAYPTSKQRAGETRKLVESDIDLDNVLNPDYTYGWSKLTGEYLAQFAEAEGCRVHVFRPFSGYGGEQALDYPFPSFIDRAKRKADPFEIWGDGKQIRDFIHIRDLVAAMLAAIENDVPGPTNLGWSRATDFNELARMVTRAAGYSPEFEHRMAEPVGVQFRVCDNTKMLGFYQPQIDLELGVTLALLGKA
jgi:nucleoside-diphosphate-sugar epimerase